MPSPHGHYDAVIIGGGFAGAGTAILLRRECPSARILLVERQRAFDRKVGEATVEVSAHFMLEVLRLGDELVREHLPKHGLVYWFHRNGDESFDQLTEVGASPAPSVPSFLLDRAKLDEQLFQLAAREGVEVLRPGRVLEAEPSRSGGRCSIDAGGNRTEICATWILDASGRRRWLGQRLGLHEPLDALPTNAMWGRWRGVRDIDGPDILGPDLARPRLPRTPRRRGLCTNHFMGDGYWIWMIPLGSGETSVGIVFDPRHMEPPKDGRARETYTAFVRSRPGLRELLAGAELADFRSFQHLPYTTKRYAGDGYALIGDAASFLDPYYSPGLDHAAMSIFATVKLVAADLEDGRDSAETERAIEQLNERFTRSTARWFDALYRDKYELFGDAELTAAAFYLDTALYYMGVVGPVVRDVERFAIPTFGGEGRGFRYAASTVAFYRRRLVKLSRARRARGALGAKNAGWRSLSGGFGTGEGRGVPGPLWRGLRLWFTAELKELNPFKGRSAPKGASAQAPRPARTTT